MSVDVVPEAASCDLVDFCEMSHAGLQENFELQPTPSIPSSRLLPSRRHRLGQLTGVLT